MKCNNSISQHCKKKIDRIYDENQENKTYLDFSKATASSKVCKCSSRFKSRSPRDLINRENLGSCIFSNYEILNKVLKNNRIVQNTSRISQNKELKSQKQLLPDIERNFPQFRPRVSTFSEFNESRRKILFEVKIRFFLKKWITARIQEFPSTQFERVLSTCWSSAGLRYVSFCNCFIPVILRPTKFYNCQSLLC